MSPQAVALKILLQKVGHDLNVDLPLEDLRASFVVGCGAMELRKKLKEPQFENELRFFGHSVLCCCELFLSKTVSKNEK